MSEMIFHVVLSVCAIVSVMGLLVTLTRLVRAVADISLNVHRMTSWTFDMFWRVDATNTTHCPGCGARDCAGVTHSGSNNVAWDR